MMPSIVTPATPQTPEIADSDSHETDSDSTPSFDAIQPITIVTSPDQLNKFSLGRILATPGAIGLAQIHQIILRQLLLRHAIGDWGDLCHDDQRANFEALANGGRLMSSYVIRTASPNHGVNSEPSEVKFWVITEADRAATTVLLPEEY